MENDRDILLVAILTFITVSLWIFFEFVKTTNTSTISSDLQQVLTPLNSSVDTSVLSILGERKIYK